MRQEEQQGTRVAELTPQAREVLKRICAEYAAMPVTADQVDRVRPEFLCRAEQALALGELLQAGMLELRQRIWGEKLYQIPQLRLPWIQRSFWTVQPLRPAEGRVRVDLAARTGLAGELFRALVFTAQEGLPLTAKGVIHKKQISRLAGRLSMQEEDLAGLALQSPGPELYPLPAAVLVDLMAVLGLIRRHSAGYSVDRNTLHQWLGLTGQEMTDTLYRIVINRYGSPEPAGQHFRHLLSAAEFPPEEWFAVPPVLEWMINSGLAAEELGADRADTGLLGSALAWLRCLAGFGWCELGYSVKGEPCFRWKQGKPQLAGEGAEAMAAAPAPTVAGADPAVPCATAPALDSAEQGQALEREQVQSLEREQGQALEREQVQVQAQEREQGQEQEQEQAGSGSGASGAGPTGEDRSPPEIAGDTVSGRFIVQPDFEVLVPPDVPYTIRWTLAGYAELLHNEDLWCFRLTREMLELAAEQGSSPEAGIAWLADHAEGGLPEQVELSLRQWAKGIGRTALSEVLLLSCASETEGEDIAAHPRLQDILTRIGPLHFIVRPECTGQLRKELAASGMAPPGIIGGREDAAQQHNLFEACDGSPAAVRYEPSFPAGERGLFGSAAQLQLLPPETAVMEQGLLPGEDTIPQMWLSQWRQYHVTTAQKVMEQALHWGIKVRISYQGETSDFIPEQISGRPWSVRGILLRNGSGTGEEIQLAAGDWQEMKLLNPYKQRNSSSAGAAGYVMIR